MNKSLSTDELLDLLREIENKYGHEKTSHALSLLTMERSGVEQSVGSLRDQTVAIIHRADRGDAVLMEQARNKHTSLKAAIDAVISKSKTSGNDTWPKSIQPYRDDVRLAKVRAANRFWFNMQADDKHSTAEIIKEAIKSKYIDPIRKRSKNRRARPC